MLVQGVGGGVGTALIRLGRVIGVRVLGTDREEKGAHLESEAGVLIDFEHEDVVQRCRQLTDGFGVDVAYDGIGATARQSLMAARPGGRLIWFGMVTALLDTGRRDLGRMTRTALSATTAFAHNLRPMGRRTSLCSIQVLARRHPEWNRAGLSTLVGVLDGGYVACHIAKTWSLDEVLEAIGRLPGGSLPGKQVIAVDD